MSWAEIKKAVNSDLSVPLNEQIDRDFAAVKSVEASNYKNPFKVANGEVTTSANSWTNALTVTGKGLLYLASIKTPRRYQGLEGTTYFKITIDDKSVTSSLINAVSAIHGDFEAAIIHSKFFHIGNSAYSSASNVFIDIPTSYSSNLSMSTGNVAYIKYEKYTAESNSYIFPLGTAIDRSAQLSNSGIDLFADIIDEPILFNSTVSLSVFESPARSSEKTATIIYVPLE